MYIQTASVNQEKKSFQNFVRLQKNDGLLVACARGVGVMVILGCPKHPFCYFLSKTLEN